MKLAATRSLTFRLTLLFAAVSTTVLLALGLVVGHLVERHFEEMDLELLEGKLELVSSALARIGTPVGLASVGETLDAALVGHHGLSVAIWLSPEHALYQTPGSFFPEALRTEATTVPQRWRDGEGLSFRGISRRAAVGYAADAPVVSVSTDLGHHEHFMRSFRLALWMVVGVAALVSGLLGLVAVRKGLAPLGGISRHAAQITATKLGRRLSTEAIPSELEDVVRTLNEMLSRLEESFQRLSHFSSDLAHELRTPVSNLLTQTQVTLSKARSAGEYEDILVSNVEEFERLSKMIADMLFLAKADNHQVVPELANVDLRAEVESVIEFYQALAEDKGVVLSVEGQAGVRGDRLMLRRAIGNLLSNAIRHTPGGGRVGVLLRARAEEAILAVENTGETIAAEHLPRLFDRFYRADPARKRQAEGVGLGLAIVRSIVRAYGGEVSVISTGGVTAFELRLPRQALGDSEG